MKVRKTEITATHIKYIILGISLAFGMVYLIMYLQTAMKPEGFDIYHANHNFLAIGLMIITGPVGWFIWYIDRRTSMLEDKFAEFLRDLAEYWRVGLSMTSAVDTISRGEYGVLTKDVQKMAAQISWGVAFNEVLRAFAGRLKTKIVDRSVSLIEEANKAGGKISDVLVTAAEDAAEIKWLQKERRKGVSMYVMVI
jgi:pilus assembly protein TadC